MDLKQDIEKLIKGILLVDAVIGPEGDTLEERKLRFLADQMLILFGKYLEEKHVVLS